MRLTAVLVEATRGPLVETRHVGSVAVADATGRLLCFAGDPGAVTFWRSAAKPFQAALVVVTGAADRFGLADGELAIACASHGGEEIHLRTVVQLLQRAGLGPEALRCGAAAPLDRGEAEALLRRGQGPTPLHNNCSGKHAGMLAVCRHLGLDPDDYRERDHPVQRRILELVAAVAGVEPAAVALAVDGCGVPTFGLSLVRMATAYARLMAPEAADLPSELVAALTRVREAMVAHPYLVAGRGRPCTELMRAYGGGLVAKSGAGGVYCIGLAPRLAARCPLLEGARGGVGIALKVDDGSTAARDAAAVGVLAELGLLDLLPAGARASLAARCRQPMRNLTGRVVGELRAAVRLVRPSA